LETYKEALRVYRSGKHSRIVITGGRGRFFDSALAMAENYGIEVEKKAEVSEAELIYQVMQKMVQEEQEFADLRQDNIVFKLETRSTNTPQNLQFYRDTILAEEGALSQENYGILYIQTPHQQLRSKATFDQVFPEQNILGFSHTVDYDQTTRSSGEISQDLIAEAWRLLLYSQERGNGTINLSETFEGGIDGLPASFWQNVLNLFGELDSDEQQRLAQDLKIMMEKTAKDGKPLSFDALIDSTQTRNPMINKFVQTIKEREKAQSSSPVSGDEDVGGIDLNEIEVDRQGAGVDIQFDPIIKLQEIIDVGIDGFTPVIINLTPLPSVLPLLGLDPRKDEEYEVSSLN
jgi:hypothetical protein